MIHYVNHSGGMLIGLGIGIYNRVYLIFIIFFLFATLSSLCLDNYATEFEILIGNERDRLID